MLLIVWVLYAAVFALVCARVATEKNRDAETWGLLGFFLGTIALIALAAIPALEPFEDEYEGIEDEDA